MICSLQQLILNCCSVGFSVFYRFYNKRKLRGTNEMTSEWNYKNLNSARNGPSDQERGETDVFAGYSYRWSEDIDRQHNWSAFSLSRLEFFFSTRLALYFSTQISESRLVFFFRSWTYILQISTHIFYCIRCILQVSTYVLCFQHVFTIGIILPATERHTFDYGCRIECVYGFGISSELCPQSSQYFLLLTRT